MSASHDPEAVSRHYDTADLGARILAALEAAGKDLDRLTPEDLAPLDQFHMGGRDATMQLARLANLSGNERVLDAGGGIGGPARTLATELGCEVTVVDLSASFCETGTMLTERLGLSHKVGFLNADATSMPLPDAGYDVVWTQHSSMNIGDKEGLYTEIHRVLKPGGRFAIHEVMAGPNTPVHFPVPWAEGPEISFLRSPAEMSSLIASTGFEQVAWNDLTPAALAAWRQRLSAASEPGAIGLHVLLGPEFATMSRNLLRNLEEQRVEVVQAVFDKV